MYFGEADDLAKGSLEARLCIGSKDSSLCQIDQKRDYRLKSNDSSNAPQ
jgi:hypothetical protein